MRPVVVSYYTAGTPYEADAAKLARTCDRFGYEHDISGISAFGSWDAVTRLKPGIIRAAAERHPGKPLLFLDADCWFKREEPWLSEEHGDLAVAVVDPLRVPPGKFIQRHKYQGLRRGGLWASGRVLFRRGQTLSKILDSWQWVCIERSQDWGDQFCLQIACERIGVVAETMPDEVVRSLGHNSGFHRHVVETRPLELQPKPERKVLMLGSAPGVVEWWERARPWHARHGFAVVAINNAWRVPNLDELDLWLHPADYVGPEPPPCVPHNSTLCYRGRGFQTDGRFDNWIVGPHWVRKVRTTATDALTHMLNEAIHDEVRLTMHVAGCDMVYPSSGPTHFYGNGPADPLRYTQEQLDKALRSVRGFYESAGAVLLNVGGQSETRLPFDRLEVAA